MVEEHFGRTFRWLDERYLSDLRTLARDGCIYNYLHQDDIDDYSYVRVRLTPAEIVRFVDGLVSLDEFHGGLQQGLPPEEAIDRISSLVVRREVEIYNEWALESGHRQQTYCAAAFLGDHLESLVCTTVPGRTEVLGRTYTADRGFLLRELIEGLPATASFLAGRQGDRPPFLIENEQDLRDLFFALVKPVFGDAALEDPAPKQAGTSKRIDVVIPTLNVVIELKVVRNAAHARAVGDELRIDIESYYSHPNCQRLVCVVWDPRRELADRQALIADLSGSRNKDGVSYVVEVWVLP